MSGHGEDAPGPPPTSASPQHTSTAAVNGRHPAATGADASADHAHDAAPDYPPEHPDLHPSRRISLSSSIGNNMGSSTPTNPAKTRTPPPQSLPPGSIAQAQAQFPMTFTTQLQLQVNTKACATSSPPTLNLVPATPGPPPTGGSKPSTSDPLASNPSTLSKHKGLPVLPYLVTPKEEKSHGTILGLWEFDDGHPSGKPPSKVAKSNKGPPSTSGSSKVVTSMGAEAGRKALLALQSVAAEEGGPISSGGPRKKASMQQLTSKFTILAPPLSSSLSVASAPVSPQKERDIDSIGTGMSQNTPFESISLPATPTASENRSHCLPENGFFLAVMSVYWSNLVGPRIEQIWTPRVGCPDESTLNLLAKQILNGEVMRTTDAIEPKMVILQEEGLIALSYLYTANPSMADGCSYNSTTLGTTTGTLAMSTKFVLSFVVPLVYLQNFSSFFDIMSDHAPVLIEVLRGLRAGLRLNVALDMFAEEHLVPFVEDIMTMEAVAMAIEGAKASHIALGREGDQVFGREFINRAITSHLQTNSSTVVVGNNITIMNMMINTLALFLSAEDRAKSCHARKQHRYLPNLFLQGIYTPSIGKQSHAGNSVDGDTYHSSRKSDRNGRLYHILSSPFPTTIVDTVRCKVEQTERLPKYSVLRSDYRKEQAKCVVERSISRVAAWSTSSQAGYLYQGSIPPQNFQKNSGDVSGFWGARRDNSWTSVEWKGQKTVRQVQIAAPMVENLVRCVVGLPIEMREGYVRQWRRGLVKRALAVVKFVKKEGVDLAEQMEQHRHNRSKASDQEIPNGEDGSRPAPQTPQAIFQQLGVDSSDLSIVLGTAERILPSITEFVRVHLGVE
ncbi:hypothetical protein BGZ99_002498 [Dissophora globulifera]|uniref:Uncharacterized protein n=1 Tax=Dissophora globulifera TaxID=979702 RepID=A0A9P6RNJ4_9FUNG|nr:hypothetical protein BGZ99_002498 [Dissophora globulifera]